MTDKINVSIEVEQQAPTRLDQYLSEQQSQYSRSKWQDWIKSGEININGQVIKKPNYKVQSGDVISADIVQAEQVEWQAQALPLTIVYEDDDLIVINKAADCVVHPAAGHADNTLVNALLHHCPELDKLPRAGIIHRLDKDTTGLLVVPKNLEAHHSLTQQLQARTMKREYVAIVFGNVIAGGTIDKPMGRHPKNRVKMAIVDEGKEAITHYTVKTRFAGFTELAVKLETGRTHQIRVHLNSIQFPIIGDPLYCGKPQWPKGTSEPVKLEINQFNRQALHARQLSLIHPSSEEWMTWSCEPPEDYCKLLACLREHF
jgi:23S rRNA pseudouridine1911/1915/1917 synthase